MRGSGNSSGGAGRGFWGLEDSVMGGWREGDCRVERDDLEASGFDQGWRGGEGARAGTKHQEPKCEMVPARSLPKDRPPDSPDHLSPPDRLMRGYPNVAVLTYKRRDKAEKDK